MHTTRFVLGLFESDDLSLVGGKAANLGVLGRQGFPVPDGLVVTTRAYQHARSHGQGTGAAVRLTAEVSEEILTAYRAMGSPWVAVRSSATAEDMAGASMAGQYETFLNIQGDKALLDAVQGCWASLSSPRVEAYLREHSIDPAEVAMAVVVQSLVAADVAGVLFTTDPRDNGSHQMLLEASWGLGEMVVSGRVQPDILRLDYETGEVLETSVSDKKLTLAPGQKEPVPVEPARRMQACLAAPEVRRLWELGRRTAEQFGCPMDIEWALSKGSLFLLQSRPITTLQHARIGEDLLAAAQARLRQDQAAGRGPWVLHNLAETLPHPTPLTWSVMRRLMSGAGGLGTMYRQAGFEPSAAVCKDGFLECIGGRIYMDVSLAPEMLFQGFPFKYDPHELSANPDASQGPPTLPAGSAWGRWKAGQRLRKVSAKVTSLAARLPHELREDLFEEVSAYVSGAKALNLGQMSPDRLQELWQEHQRWVLEVFGPRLLMPGLVTAMAMAELRTFLQDTVWEEDADGLAALISSGGQPDRNVQADIGLYEVGKGRRPLRVWLSEHGHRATGEFDLAAARWRESPAAVRRMADRLATGDGPQERHRSNAERVDARVAALSLRLRDSDREEFDLLVSQVRRAIALREDSKDVLMLGYELLRDVALEAGRRLGVGQDVFFMTSEEMLQSLRTGSADRGLIERRKAEYAAEARLRLPRMIDAASIDTLGRVEDARPAAGGHKALAVSSGTAAGPARIVTDPADAGDLGRGYILVCPSTDPSWTPLFVNAAGLVLECGGTLSHGAVVAREMGLPAVVLPDATRWFGEGQQIHVDGLRGWAGPAQGPHGRTLQAVAADPCDTVIAKESLPPPAGRKDRAAARWSGRAAVVWAVFLFAFFMLPQTWVQRPVMAALDAALWPMARSLGKPAVVAVVAAAVAILTLAIQKWTTDNDRLREARRRAAGLKKEALQLARQSPRRAALIRVAAGVEARSLAAALVPVGLLLGVLVMPFVWFRQRVDPSLWTAQAGSTVQVMATVDGSWTQTVRIDLHGPAWVDDSTPQSRTLPPIRATLERLLALSRQPRDTANEPWELGFVPELRDPKVVEDLKAYLDAGVGPQGVTWLVRTPDYANGRFSAAVTAEGHRPVIAEIGLGQDDPPGPVHTAGPAGSPVREVRVVYPRPAVRPVFWQPLAFLAATPALPLASRLAVIDIGWLGLYVLMYVPVLMLTRAALKVA